MKFIMLFLTAIFLTTVSLGQPSESPLLKAYKKKSNKLLQKFIDTWVNETNFKIDSNEISNNDTVKNIYDVLNTFYHPIYPLTKCILIQPNLRYKIVDNLDKDTLLKRAIFKIPRNNRDSIYKEVIKNPDSYDFLSESYAQGIYITGGSMTISMQNLFFKSKKLLPLTEKYKSILLDFLWTSNSLNRIEELKRLNFLKGEIEFFRGMGGYLKINNSPSDIAITFDSSFKNATIYCRGDTGGGTSVLKKINDKWVTVIESLGDFVE